MSKAVAHIVGFPVVIQGHLCRQRCAWCGHLIVDVDVELVAVAEGQGGYDPFWPTNAVVEIEITDGGTVTRMSVVKVVDGLLPDNACTPPRPRANPLKLVT